jgi:hypothetical protein
MMKKTTTKRTGTAGAGKTALALAFLLAAAGTVSAEDGLAVAGDEPAVAEEAVPAVTEDGLAVTGGIYTALVIEKAEGDATALLLNDDNPGRANFTFALTKGDFVAKWQLRATGLTTIAIPYAFGTGSFLDGQIGVTVGKIDGALWGSGGKTDASYDAVTGARFEFKPAALSGLSAGFFLPGVTAAVDKGLSWSLTAPTTPTPAPTSPTDVTGVGTGSTWEVKKAVAVRASVADFFSEIGFGLKYAPADLIDLRFGVKLDGTADGGWDYTKEEWIDDGQGVKLLWGLSPTILTTFVPGLTVWLDGEVRGLGGVPVSYYTLGKNGGATAGLKESGYTTKTGLAISFDNPATVPLLNVYAKAAFETWAGDGTYEGTKYEGIGGTVFGAFLGGSYKVTPWLKPGLETEMYFRSYQDDYKTAYKAAEGEDPAGFDRFFLKLYAEMALGNGFTVTPSYSLTYHSAYGTFGYATPQVKASDDSRLDHKAQISLAYSF